MTGGRWLLRSPGRDGQRYAVEIRGGDVALTDVPLHARQFATPGDAYSWAARSPALADFQVVRAPKN